MWASVNCYLDKSIIEFIAQQRVRQLPQELFEQVSYVMRVRVLLYCFTIIQMTLKKSVISI